MPLATPQDRLEGYTWALAKDGVVDDAPFTRAVAMTLFDRETWTVRAKIDAAVDGQAKNVGTSLAALERDDGPLAGLFERLKDPRRSVKGKPLEVHRINPERLESVRPSDLHIPVALTTLLLRERLLSNGQDLQDPVMDKFRELEAAIHRTMPRNSGKRQLPDSQRKLLFLLALSGEREHVPNSGGGVGMLNQKAALALKNNMKPVEETHGKLLPIPRNDGPPRYRISPKMIEFLGEEEALHGFMDRVVGFDDALWREAVPIHFKTRAELEALGRKVEKRWPAVPSNGAGHNSVELDSRRRYRLKETERRGYLPELRGAEFRWVPQSDREVRDRGDDPESHAFFTTEVDGREQTFRLLLEHVEAI